jgi:hypothetical protein
LVVHLTDFGILKRGIEALTPPVAKASPHPPYVDGLLASGF